MTFGPSAKAIAKFTRWKQNMLDLSSRNPQLNFSSKKYLEIIHPDPATIFKILVILGQTGTFPSIYKTKMKKTKKTKKTETIEDESNINNKIENPSNNSADENGINNSLHQDAINKAKNEARLTEFITELSDEALLTRFQKLLQMAAEAEQERGVNILFLTLGLLTWNNTADHTKLTSPILFIPIKLNINPLEISILDDSVVFNPALQEKLLMQKIRVPKFPEEFDSKSYMDFFDKLKDAIERDWKIEDRVFIGTFAFTKASLFDDLDKHQDALLRHPVIKAIAEETGFIEPKEHLPSEKELGDLLEPQKTYSILDCDSSQMEAVLYAKSGSSLVIQGPPGTGKSQAITNIISESLAIGKRVLFVAQKKAAIDVVKKRLEKCGLGEFCLPIYSQNANKQEILATLESSLNYDFQTQPIREEKFQELFLIRQRLNEYTELINRPFGHMKLSAYQILGKLILLENVPLLDIEIRDPNLITDIDFVRIRDIFVQLEKYRATIERFNENPWSTAQITNPLIVSNELKVILRKTLSRIAITSPKLKNQVKQLQKKYPAEFWQNQISLSQWESTSLIGKYWQDVFQNVFDLWCQLDADYKEITQYFEIDTLINYDDLRTLFQPLKQLQLAYQKDIPKDKKMDIYLQEKLREYLGTIEEFHNRITVFNLKSHLNPIKNDSDLLKLKRFFDVFRSKSLLLDAETLIARFTIDYVGTFKQHGDAYNRDKENILECVRDPDPKANLMGYLNIIKNFQDEWGKPIGITPEVIQERVKEFYELGQFWEKFRSIENFFHPLFALTRINCQIDDKIFEDLKNFSTQWLGNLPFLPEWFEVEIRSHHLQDLGFINVLNTVKNKKITYPTSGKGLKEAVPYALLFEKIFFSKWIQDIIESLPPLANFNSELHNNDLKQFQRLDEEILLLNQARLQNHLSKLRPKSDLEDSANTLLPQIGFIKREQKKKRNIQPLRSIFSEARDLIMLLKPCIMMSPLAIANYLAIKEYEQFFDLVIFDEASQITPEDAIGAMLRGKSVIVVGDAQQLPPTNFFTASKIDPESDKDALEAELDVNIQTMESILDECTGIGFREKMLKFHYRSRKEGLIAFSNQEYYNGQLFTFPDLATNTLSISSANKTIEFSDEEGLENYSNIVEMPAIAFKYVKGGQKDKARNIIEAKAISKAIIAHYRSNEKYKTNYSLGVIAFSEAQQETIQKELELLLHNDPSLETIIDRTDENGLFIKNLENVQGDERDFIFFSVGYARDSSGHMSLNFGPLNRTGGHRRLNVAITRARFHIKIFASFIPTDIDLEKVNARGLRDLIRFLEFARSGKLPSKQIEGKTKEIVNEKDPFLFAVQKTLEEHGFQSTQNLGASKFKINLALIDPLNPARYRVGIILDSGSYSEAQVARDRDRIRNQILESLGWQLYHLWSLDWTNHRSDLIHNLIKLLKKNTP